MPCPFGLSVHGTSLNALVHFDYIEGVPSLNKEKKVFVLKDYHLNYKRFLAFTGAASSNASLSVMNWCSAVDFSKMWKFDSPTYTKNETAHMLQKSLKVEHHFILSYSPWSNGAVERPGKELQRVLRSVCSKMQLRLEKYTDQLAYVQGAFNSDFLHSMAISCYCLLLRVSVLRHPSQPSSKRLRSLSSFL